MNLRPVLCSLLLTLPLMAHAVESEVESIKSPTTHNREVEVGDKAPDQYKRDEAAIKDWKAKGLPAPEKESHWVKMDSHYVLVQTTNGVILAIHNAKK